MKAAGSVLALFSVLFVCLIFLLVWAGTENVQFEWVSMTDDPSVAAVDQHLRTTAEEGQTDKVTLDAPAHQPASAAGSAAKPYVQGVDCVVWINISGFRGDYLEHTETPFLDSLANKGSFTSELQPPFPSLHYPSLVSQATGRPVKEHGVVADKLRDPATGQVVDHPTDLSLLKGEPIWTTARRQGIGVLVHHWPFSQKQPAEHAADIFLPEVNFTSPAEERLSAVLTAWTGHQKEPKIRLVMVNLMDINQAARAYGTRQKETYAAVEKLDKTLASFRDRLREKWPTLHATEGDRLYFFITTDHGMVDVKKVINFGALMGDLAQQVDYAACDAVAQIWFKKQPEGTDQKQFEEAYDSELKSRIYWRTYTREELPEAWKLDKGPQMGDRFLMLKSGYAFTDKTGSEPVFDPSETGGPFCASGYWVTDQARMLGQAFFCMLDGESGSGTNLGAVDCTQLHATVCELLGIETASGVRGRSLRIR